MPPVADQHEKILRWERIVSIETLGALFVTVFMIGVSWANLSGRADAAEKKVDQMEQATKIDRQTIQDMRASIRVIESNQARLGKDIQVMQEDLKEILREVRKSERRE